jgi:hypothetical protein
MEIKLLSRKEIKAEIKNLIDDAILIKGTVAFWTWEKDYIDENFGMNFFKALKNSESFFCVDISTPITNINEISKCSAFADNFYVFSYKFKNIKGTPLLHSKITYIECKDSHNIILGSHNNTNKAFSGVNFEHSLHIKFSKNLNTEDRLFLDKILFELENIKSLCIKFNPKSLKYFKSLYINPISIFLKFDSLQLTNIQKNSTISIISLDLFDIKKDEYRNIYNKDVLLFLCDYQKKIIKYYLAKGEADDKVAKDEMEEKVTTSDFIALKIVSVLDHLGLSYPFYASKNKLIKGSALNIGNHMIQRVKIIKELAFEDVLLIDENNSQNIYKEIDIEDLHLLGVDESEKDKILKIDKLKYNSKDEDGNAEQIKSLNIENFFISNTTSEIEIKIYDKFDKIFSLLFKSEDYFYDEEVLNNKTLQLNKILEIINDGNTTNLINEFDDISSNGNTKKLKDLALNFFNNNLIDKKSKNKLGQFQSNFHLKKIK